MSDSETAADVANEANWRTILMVVLAVLGIGVLIALVITLGNADAARDRALKRQSHSYEVMILARDLANTMAESEAALGRYVISAERQDGATFGENWRRAAVRIDRLEAVTRGDPSQQSAVRGIREAYLERGEELRRISYHVARREYSKAYAFFGAARDTPALRNVMRRLSGFIAAERRLLDTRSNEARASVARSERVTQVLIAFGILLVLGAGFLGWLMITALRNQASATAEADAERARAANLEAAVAEATASLREEAREREAAEAQLRQAQKMEAVGQLTGGIAHDFNNMLGVVISGLELARRKIAQGADPARHIDNAMEGANRAAALTRRLLAFSRAEALRPEAVCAGVVIGGMSDLMERTLGDGIEVDTNDTCDDWLLWVDRHQLESALLNLAVNARDAMDGRGRLTIVSGRAVLADGEVGECRPGEHVTITVSDTGCGMTPDVLERVFEPFFTTKPVGRGTGLGLSQVFGFARQSGGDLKIESTPGEGTRVTLYLPRHIGAAADAPARDDERQVQAGAPVRLRVLVIEDDPRVLNATVGALEELGHQVTAADDPLAVAAMLDRVGPLDLIVSDVLMPGKTGPELIGELSPRLGGVGVLFVTGFAGDEPEGDRFGGHPVLRKPFTLAGLESGVAEAMRRARAPARTAKVA